MIFPRGTYRPLRQVALFALGAALVLGAASCGDAPLAPDSQTPFLPEVSFSPLQETDFVPGRVLARFRPGAVAAEIARGVGAEVAGDVALGIRMLRVPEGAEQRVAQALSRNPNVEFAEVDLIRTFGDPAAIPVNDPYIGYKWDLDNDGYIYNSSGAVIAATGSVDADMDWVEAWEQLGPVSGSAKIGIMDTGIRADHEELAGRIAAQYDFFAGDANAADDYGHGTHVAGIAAGAVNNDLGVAGVAFATNVQFVIAKVCGQTFIWYGCPSSAIAQGITWAVDNGANVLNLSLGGSSGSDAERVALQYARAHDVLPFCAAGNESGPVSYPAAFPECVAVSATNWSDGSASYSNFGSQVELAAPGGDSENADGFSYILSSYYESSTSYAFMAGTSMASPQAAGLGALLHALGKTDDDEKLAIMTSTADDLGAAGKDILFGHGRINVYRAVNGLGGGGDENQPPTAAFSYSCPLATCSFVDTSTDSDGSIVAWSWSFGDGGTSNQRHPSHTYAATGTYTVTLTVTDDDGATDGATDDVTVTVPSLPDIILFVEGHTIRNRNYATLMWSEANGRKVDVYRNGSLITSTTNDGLYTNSLGKSTGTFVYKVCETRSDVCSNEASVKF